MKKIVLLSDTHGLLREEVKALLAEADAVVHAGDFDTPEVADALRACAEPHLVRGNNDGAWAEDLPRTLAFTIEGVRFFLAHNRRDVPRGLNGVDVVVCGHSHKYASEDRGGVLWLNPGGCGRRRFGLEITLCLMEVDAGRYRVEKIFLPREG